MLPVGVDICIVSTSGHIRSFMERTPISRKQITCFRCGEQGHYKSECFQWKTKPCWHFQNLGCKDEFCSFAHDGEIRTPWLPKCIRVTKKDGCIVISGCKMVGHTFKTCPFQTCQTTSFHTTQTTASQTLSQDEHLAK